MDVFNQGKVWNVDSYVLSIVLNVWQALHSILYHNWFDVYIKIRSWAEKKTVEKKNRQETEAIQPPPTMVLITILSTTIKQFTLEQNAT